MFGSLLPSLSLCYSRQALERFDRGLEILLNVQKVTTPGSVKLCQPRQKRAQALTDG